MLETANATEALIISSYNLTKYTSVIRYNCTPTASYIRVTNLYTS